MTRNRDMMPLARARAGVMRRFTATMIDLVVSGALATGPAFFIVAVSDVAAQTLPLLSWYLMFSVWPLLGILTTWRFGRTPGKWVMGTRTKVFDPDHPNARLQIGQILLREGFFKAAIPLSFIATPGTEWITFILWSGMLLSIRFRIDRRALHDQTTSTQVVRTRGQASKDAIAHTNKKAAGSQLKALNAGDPKVLGPKTLKQLTSPGALGASSQRDESSATKPTRQRSSRKKKKGRRRR